MTVIRQELHISEFSCATWASKVTFPDNVVEPVYMGL